MESFVALLMTGIALEAGVHLLKIAWDVDARASWNTTKIAVAVIPVFAAFMTQTNLVSESGLDFGIDVVGYVISGLIVGRLAQWVHDIYKKTM